MILVIMVWVRVEQGSHQAFYWWCCTTICMACTTISALEFNLHHQYHSQLCALGPLTATIFTEDAVSSY